MTLWRVTKVCPATYETYIKCGDAAEAERLSASRMLGGWDCVHVGEPEHVEVEQVEDFGS